MRIPVALYEGFYMSIAQTGFRSTLLARLETHDLEDRIDDLPPGLLHAKPLPMKSQLRAFCGGMRGQPHKVFRWGGPTRFSYHLFSRGPGGRSNGLPIGGPRMAA